MVLEIVFLVDRLPHPDSRHLGSRIWTKALMGKYGADRIVIIPRDIKYLEELKKYVSDYLDGYRVSYKIKVMGL